MLYGDWKPAAVFLDVDLVQQRADDVLEYLSSTFLAPRFRDLAIGHLEAKEFDAAAALYRLLLKRNHKPIWSDSGPTDLYYRAHRALESLSDMLNLLRDPQVPPFSIDVAAGWGRYIDHDAPFPADCLISHAGEGIPVVAHLLPKQSSGASGAAAEGLDAVLLPEQVRALHGEQIFELGDAGMVERRDPGWTERVRIAKVLASQLYDSRGRALDTLFLDDERAFFASVQPCYRQHAPSASASLPLLQGASAYIVTLSPSFLQSDPRFLLALLASFLPLPAILSTRARRYSARFSAGDVAKSWKEKLGFIPAFDRPALSAESPTVPDAKRAAEDVEDAQSEGSEEDDSRRKRRETGEGAEMDNSVQEEKDTKHGLPSATDFTVSYGQDGVGRYTLRRVFPPPPSSRSSSLPGSSTSSPSSSRSTFASLLANPAPLATGSSGSVYRARTQTGTELALKYGLDEDCDEEIEEEGRLLALLNAAEPALAPRLIGVYRGGYLRERVVMIMEWGGEWVKNMDDLSREDRGKIYSLFLTLHSLGYIHGDPRLANILRDETTKAFKLIDFGWSSRHDCEGEKECEELKEVKEWLDV